MSVYVCVVAGFTVSEPLGRFFVPPHPPLPVQEVAPETLHESVADCPALRVAALEVNELIEGGFRVMIAVFVSVVAESVHVSV